MKEISNHYQHLTADERFRLFVAAMGRKDDQELDRLENTAPMRTYRCVDEDYKRRKLHFINIALLSTIGWLRMELFAAVSMALTTLIEQEQETDQPDRLDVAFRKLYIAGKARRNGWKRFCESVGVDADPMLIWTTGDTEVAENILELTYERYCEAYECTAADDDEIEAKTKAEYEALRELWEDRCPDHLPRSAHPSAERAKQN